MNIRGLGPIDRRQGLLAGELFGVESLCIGVLRARLWSAALLCVALGGGSPAAVQSSSIAGPGISAVVSASGDYQISAARQGWIFQGSVGGPVQNLAVSDGTDSAGAWQQISFDHGSARSSSIRLYQSQPVVLFTTRYGQDSPNADPFP